MATLAHGSDTNPPAGLIEQVREEMLQLILANAHVLATRCAECSIHQVWAAACLANAARETSTALPSAPGSEDLCEKRPLPAEEQADPAAGLQSSSSTPPGLILPSSPEERPVAAETPGATAGASLSGSPATGLVSDSPGAKDNEREIVSEPAVDKLADKFLPQVVRTEAEDRAMVTGMEMASAEQLEGHAHEGELSTATCKDGPDDRPTAQAVGKAEATIEVASVLESRDPSLQPPSTPPNVLPGGVAVEAEAEAIPAPSMALLEEGTSTTRALDRQFSLDLTPHRKSLEVPAAFERSRKDEILSGGAETAATLQSKDASGRLSLDLTTHRRGSQQANEAVPPPESRGLPPMPQVPPPGGEEKLLEEPFSLTFPSHWGAMYEEEAWDAEGFAPAAGVAENTLAALDNNDDELDAEKELEALRSTMLELSRHLAVLGTEADEAAATVAEFGTNSTEGFGSASSSTAPPTPPVPAAFRGHPRFPASHDGLFGAPVPGPATLEYLSRRYARRVSCRAVCVGAPNLATQALPWLHRHADGSSVSLASDAARPADEREAPRPSLTSTQIERWTIRIDRSSGKPLGIDCARSKDLAADFLEIREVRPNGVIAAWNAAHLQQELRAGDRIVEVNGQSTRDSVLGELKKEGQLAVTLERKVLHTAAVEHPVLPTALGEARAEAQDGAPQTQPPPPDDGDLASERRLFEDWLVSTVAAAASLLDERDRLRDLASAAPSA